MLESNHALAAFVKLACDGKSHALILLACLLEKFLWPHSVAALLLLS